MVPSSYLKFMITSAGAAGAMIGLLFVAISMRSSFVFGANASAKARALAASSFTGLVNGLCYVIFASSAIPLARAWSLLQGEIETDILESSS